MRADNSIPGRPAGFPWKKVKNVTGNFKKVTRKWLKIVEKRLKIAQKWPEVDHTVHPQEVIRFWEGEHYTGSGGKQESYKCYLNSSQAN